MSYAASIRLHAEDAGPGVMLSKFESLEDATKPRALFRAKGWNLRAASLPSHLVFLIFLPEMTLAQFGQLIAGEDVQLV